MYFSFTQTISDWLGVEINLASIRNESESWLSFTFSSCEFFGPPKVPVHCSLHAIIESYSSPSWRPNHLYSSSAHASFDLSRQWEDLQENTYSPMEVLFWHSSFETNWEDVWFFEERENCEDEKYHKVSVVIFFVLVFFLLSCPSSFIFWSIPSK